MKINATIKPTSLTEEEAVNIKGGIGKCAWYNERNLYHNGKFNLCQCLQKAPGLLDKCLEYYYEHYK